MQYQGGQPVLATQHFRHFMPWKDFVHRTFPWLEFSGRTDGAFDASAVGCGDRQRLAMEIRTDPVAVARPRRRAEADQSGYVKFFWQIAGLTEVQQGRRRVVLSPGATAVCDTARAYRLRFSGGARFAVLLLPYEACPGWNGISDRVTAIDLPDRVTCSAALNAMTALLRHSDTDDPEAVDEVLQSVQWMLASSLRRTAVDRGDGDGSESRDILSSVQRYILQHIDDAKMGPSELAAAVSASRRSLYSMLERHGLTPARLISDMRVECCKKVMANRHRRDLTITQIAFAHGFTDAAQFSHLFKARTGLSPRAWRERALQEPYRSDAAPPEEVCAPASSASDADAAGRTDGSGRAARFTARERQVLDAIVGGQGNAAIAEALFVSQNTVKYHVKNIYAKLGVRGRVQAIRAAETLGEY